MINVKLFFHLCFERSDTPFYIIPWGFYFYILRHQMSDDQTSRNRVQTRTSIKGHQEDWSHLQFKLLTNLRRLEAICGTRGLIITNGCQGECEPKTSKFWDEVVYWTFAIISPQRMKIFWRVLWIEVSRQSVNHLQGQAVIGVILGVLVICPFDEESRFHSKKLILSQISQFWGQNCTFSSPALSDETRSRDHFWDQNGLKMVSRPFWDQNVTLPRVTRLVSRPYSRPK